MPFPDTVVLFFYQPRTTFLEKASKEKTTGIVKSKYKLIFKRHEEMGIFVFFILTTDKDSCVGERTFSIFPDDWEQREEKYLKADCSYIDVQKYEILTKEEVLERATNRETGFSYAGKIFQSKFSELHTVAQNYTQTATIKTDFTLRDALKEILGENKTGAFVQKFQI